jgi:hypothetical protein
MYECVVKIMKDKTDATVRVFVDETEMSDAAKSAEGEVRKACGGAPITGVSTKLAGGAIVIMKAGEKPYWLHREDMLQVKGQTALKE